MTSDLDIYRTANLLVKRHGRDVSIEAAMRADSRGWRPGRLRGVDAGGTGGGRFAEGGAGAKRCGELNSATIPAAGHWPLQSSPMARQTGTLAQTEGAGFKLMVCLQDVCNWSRETRFA